MEKIKLVNNQLKAKEELKNKEIEVTVNEEFKIEKLGSLEDGDSNEFNSLLSHVYRNVTSGHDYGGWAEYYDEDGLVLMTTQDEMENTILFDFGTGDEFRFNKEGFSTPVYN